jgi:hypothetical protein
LPNSIHRGKKHERNAEERAPGKGGVVLSFILRTLHVPPFWVFVVVFGLYFVYTGWVILAGFMREITGWKHPGQPSRMHRVMWQLHSGLHIHPGKSYGDESSRTKTYGGGQRAIYYSPWKRWHRAVRNNLIVLCCLCSTCGMAIAPADTVRADVLLILTLALAGVVFLYYRIRARFVRRRPVSKTAMSMTNRAKAVLRHDDQTVGATSRLEINERPQLHSDVPTRILAGLLANQMSCSTIEAITLMHTAPDGSHMRLPDQFPALDKQKDTIEEIIRNHNQGDVRFDWGLTAHPRQLGWYPMARSTLPSMALFREYLPEIEACGPGEFAIGLQSETDVYQLDHNGDNPWWVRSANAGTGKSTGFLVKAAQVAHRDPAADIYCVDTKQVSFEHLRGIPGIFVLDDPESHMPDIWKVFYTLEGVLRQRYADIRTGKAKLSDFNDVWLFVDEGNDLAGYLKSYYIAQIRDGGPINPVIWSEAIAPILRLGRQAKIRGEWMFQDVTDRALGGESLKMAFSTFGMAGYKVSQFNRIVGPPAPPLQTGPGRILMCRGNSQTWVQGFYDDEQFLHEYALENRRDRAA